MQPERHGKELEVGLDLLHPATKYWAKVAVQAHWVVFCKEQRPIGGSLSKDER